MLPEGPRRVENEGLEPSRALLGAMWAQGGRQERSGAKKNIGWAPGPPRGEKLIDFRVPGRSVEGSGAPERYFWSFFGHAPWEPQKHQKLRK